MRASYVRVRRLVSSSVLYVYESACGSSAASSCEVCTADLDVAADRHHTLLRLRVDRILLGALLLREHHLVRRERGEEGCVIELVHLTADDADTGHTAVGEHATGGVLLVEEMRVLSRSVSVRSRLLVEGGVVLSVVRLVQDLLLLLVMEQLHLLLRRCGLLLLLLLLGGGDLLSGLHRGCGLLHLRRGLRCGVGDDLHRRR